MYPNSINMYLSNVPYGLETTGSCKHTQMIPWFNVYWTFTMILFLLETGDKKANKTSSTVNQLMS